jgi:polyisoprenoid-binding protein YceI
MLAGMRQILFDFECLLFGILNYFCCMRIARRLTSKTAGCPITACPGGWRLSGKLWHAVPLFVFFLFPALAFGQQYIPSPKDSRVDFSVHYHKNGDEKVKGRLTGLGGKILFDPAHPEKAFFDITVKPATVSIGNKEADKELAGISFFNAAAFPAIHLKSTSVSQDRPGGIIYVLHGNLTIKNITKTVNMQFVATPIGKGYLFRGSFQVNRLDFNLGPAENIDKDVALFVEVKALRK